MRTWTHLVDNRSPFKVRLLRARLLADDTVSLGSSFGPIGTPVSVSYGTYVAVGCTVVSDDTGIECQTVRGVGVNHTVQVAVSRQVSIETNSVLSYSRKCAMQLVYSAYFTALIVLIQRRW